MPSWLIHLIITYGYCAIFFLVFIQEIGIPTFPNEILLIYSGYLAYIGVLNIFLVLIIAVSADVSGTFLVYTVFYFGSHGLIKRKPKWLPISNKRIEFIKAKIIDYGDKGIFIGRLIPYLRGYTSVAAGIFKIRFKPFSMMIILSAIIWTGGYVILGWLAGNYRKLLSDQIAVTNQYLIAITFLLILFFLIKFLIKKHLLKNI